MHKLTKIISGITSPYLVIPVFSLITIGHYAGSYTEFILWSSILILLVVITPLIYVLILVKQNKITDLHVFMREQRNGPFVVAIIGSILVFGIYLYLHVPMPLISMVVAIIANGLIFAMLSKYWKLSMHMATFASSLTIVSVLVNFYWLIILPLAILIIWARLFRKRHTFAQLIIAGIISPIITYLVLALFR